MRFQTAHSPADRHGAAHGDPLLALPVHAQATEARRARLEAPAAAFDHLEVVRGRLELHHRAAPGAGARRYTPTALAFRLSAPVARCTPGPILLLEAGGQPLGVEPAVVEDEVTHLAQTEVGQLGGDGVEPLGGEAQVPLPRT